MFEYEVKVNMEKGEWTYTEWYNGTTIGHATIHNLDTLPGFLKAHADAGHMAKQICF